MPLIRESLGQGQSVRFSPRGTSMLPMLRQGRDTVILAPITDRLKAGDIALYQRENGIYVLHRVIEADKDGYFFCGDNQAQRERVDHRQLIAHVTGYLRNGREYGLDRLKDRLYCWLWIRFFGLRKYYIALRRGLGSLRRRLFN